MSDELEKEFVLEKEAAASFLHDIAESLEEDEDLKLEGDDWKVFQPVDGKVPLKLFSDEESLEIGLRIE